MLGKLVHPGPELHISELVYCVVLDTSMLN